MKRSGPKQQWHGGLICYLHGSPPPETTLLLPWLRHWQEAKQEFQPILYSKVMGGVCAKRAALESENHLDCKRPLRSLSSTVLLKSTGNAAMFKAQHTVETIPRSCYPLVTLSLEALPLFLHNQDSPCHSLQVREDARVWASKKDVNLQDSFKKQKLIILHQNSLF